VIINSFCLKFVRLKSSPQKNCLSDVDEANSIRDYFFCQQLISLDHFCASYVAKNLVGKHGVILCDQLVVKNAKFESIFSARPVAKKHSSRISF